MPLGAGALERMVMAKSEALGKTCLTASRLRRVAMHMKKTVSADVAWLQQQKPPLALRCLAYILQVAA